MMMILDGPIGLRYFSIERVKLVLLSGNAIIASP